MSLFKHLNVFCKEWLRIMYEILQLINIKTFASILSLGLSPLIRWQLIKYRLSIAIASTSEKNI